MNEDKDDISRWNIEKQAYSKNRDVMVMEKILLNEADPKTRPAFHLFINTTRRFNNRRL